jgi:O-succinylbenzoate synthase
MIPGQVHIFALPLTTRFRQLTVREGVLLKGPADWAEWSPFWDYEYPEIAAWWSATCEAAELGFPPPLRDRIPVNVTVPAVDPGRARQIVSESGCTTAKVKVAAISTEGPGSLAADLARVEAVRDALGPAGKIRVDANGAWSVAEAFRNLRELDRFELEYAEQPCASVEELAQLRRTPGMEIPIAADESIRRAADPERVVRAEAADIAVLKVQPLGGVRRCLELAERLGLPVVVSSALESSVGLRAGLALAAALPELPYACGLNTAALLAKDVATEPLLAEQGEIAVREVELSDATGWEADPVTRARWEQRLKQVR